MNHRFFQVCANKKRGREGRWKEREIEGSKREGKKEKTISHVLIDIKGQSLSERARGWRKVEVRVEYGMPERICSLSNPHIL
jgi:hypothetical protein